MTPDIYTPSEQMYHALRAIDGPWRLIGNGLHEGYAQDLYPQAFRSRAYAAVIADHAEPWLRTHVQPRSHATDTRVRLQPFAFEWVVNQRSRIQRAADMQDINTDFLLLHPLRWHIAEQITHRHQLAASTAMDTAVLLVILYFLYPDPLFADTPREYMFALPHAEQLWRELVT